MSKAKFITQNNIISGIIPLDLQTARTGEWVSMKNYNHLSVVLYKAAGTAGDDVTITMAQATVVAGTDTKALTFTDIWTKEATALTTATAWTHTAQTAAATYTTTTNAEVQAIWVIEFDAEDLDAANNFDCVNAATGDVGSNAQLGAVLYILSDPRYPQELPIDAVAD